jgi:sugar phosphate isomerase/epimerase
LLCLDLGPLPEATSPQAPKPAVTPSMAGLILLPNAVASQPASTPASPPPDPAFAAQVAAAMDEVGRRADRYNVVLAFQSELASFASLAQAVAQLNCPWFGIDLDPVAILHDTWDIDEVFSQLGPLIRHVRGRDALSGTQGRTRAAVIGEGNVDWRPLLRNLDEAGFRGWISVDPTDFTDRLSAARTGLKHLRSIRDGT